jgi:hypothetical protein
MIKDELMALLELKPSDQANDLFDKCEAVLAACREVVKLYDELRSHIKGASPWLWCFIGGGFVLTIVSAALAPFTFGTSLGIAVGAATYFAIQTSIAAAQAIRTLNDAKTKANEIKATTESIKKSTQQIENADVDASRALNKLLIISKHTLDPQKIDNLVKSLEALCQALNKLWKELQQISK